MNKVHVNVGTIGHVDHGKTTLTAALSGSIYDFALRTRWQRSRTSSMPAEWLRCTTLLIGCRVAMKRKSGSVVRASRAVSVSASPLHEPSSRTPKALIFDEATSGLDVETAEHFATTVNQLRTKITMLFIAHQLPKGLIVDETLSLRVVTNTARPV